MGMRVYATAASIMGVVLACHGVIGAPATRTWTSTSGATIEGTYVETHQGRVSLRSADGKVMAIPLTRLVPADREWIADHERAASEVTIAAPKKPNQLPTFGEGKWKRQHAVYSSENYDALMNVNGVIRIYPKERGERIGEPMDMSLRCLSQEDRGVSPRRVQAYAESPDPRMQPDRITLTGTLQDEVPFTVVYEFSETGIKALGHCKDPSGIDPTLFRVGVQVPASHSFDAESLKNKDQILKGWRLVLKPLEGKTRRYDYAQPAKQMNVPCELVSIDAPFYGDRKIRFTVGDNNEAPIIPGIYSGYSPWQGYFVGMQKEDQDSRSEKLWFAIEIK